jgi:pullulanase/glycogen debranching enzyme
LFSDHYETPFFEVELKPEVNKTGPIWHIEIEKIPRHTAYAYKVDGALTPKEGHPLDPASYLLDPYAISLSTTHLWGKHLTDDTTAYRPIGKIISPAEFAWGEARTPGRHIKDLIIYEMHVRALTAHASSKAKHPGTFLGVIEKIPPSERTWGKRRRAFARL